MYLYIHLFPGGLGIVQLWPKHSYCLITFFSSVVYCIFYNYAVSLVAQVHI